MDISENLKKKRTEKNVTQAELAKAIGISQPMMAQLERGTKNLTVNLAKEIAAVLKIDVIELIV